MNRKYEIQNVMLITQGDAAEVEELLATIRTQVADEDGLLVDSRANVCVEWFHHDGLEYLTLVKHTAARLPSLCLKMEYQDISNNLSGNLDIEHGVVVRHYNGKFGEYAWQLIGLDDPISYVARLIAPRRHIEQFLDTVGYNPRSYEFDTLLQKLGMEEFKYRMREGRLLTRDGEVVIEACCYDQKLIEVISRHFPQIEFFTVFYDLEFNYMQPMLIKNGRTLYAQNDQPAKRIRYHETLEFTRVDQALLLPQLRGLMQAINL